MRTSHFIPALALIVAACQDGSTSPVAYCTAPRSIAVLVTPVDSVTHTSVADGAHGVVQSGAYVDPLRLSSDSVLEGGAQLGTYEITLERPGYQDWIRANIQVTRKGPCGNVIPVRLTALLQPSP